MSINERVELIIRVLFKGNKSAFAKEIGITPSGVENVVGKRKGKPSFELIHKICSIEKVNTVWFVKGVGEPFAPEDEPKAAPATDDGSVIELAALKAENKLLTAQLKEAREAVTRMAKKIGRLELMVENGSREAEADAAPVANLERKASKR